MRNWIALLAPLTIWLAHFLGLWTLASVVGEGPWVRLAILVVTGVALGSLFVVWRVSLGATLENAMADWIRRLRRSSVALAALAIAWQTLPVAFG